MLAAAKISSTSKLALANATVPGVSAANAWEDAQIISTTNVGRATSPKIAFDGAGNAVAVWLQNPGFDRAVYAASGWLSDERISTGEVFYPKVVLMPGGHALAAWTELDTSVPPGTGYTIQSNRYTSGAGWGPPGPISSSGGLIGTGMPSLSVGPNGEAFAIWTRGGEVRVNRFE